MKKSFVALVIFLLALCDISFAATASELKRMSAFLSNFTEVGMYYFNIETPDDDELIYFGIMHNKINNPIRVQNVRNKKYDRAVSAKSVAESIKKYFDINIKHRTATDQSDEVYPYEKGRYYFVAADGEIPYYAEVQNAQKRGAVITMNGEIYNSKNKNDRPAEFIATAKPYVYNGKNTWALLSLSTTWK